MVKNRRIDAAFGFPVEVKYAGLEDDLIALRVAHMPPLTPVFFGVPKNHWGQTLISKINAILVAKKAQGVFSSYYEYWLADLEKTYYQTLVQAYHDEKMGEAP